MNAFASHGLAGLLMALALAAASTLQAQTFFQPVEDSRSLSFGARATVVGQTGAIDRQDVFHFRPAPTSFVPITLQDDIHLFLNPEGTGGAFLDGRMSQISFFNPTGIQYVGGMLLAAGAFGSTQPGTDGFIGGEDLFRLVFDVPSTMGVFLSLRADVPGGGSFELGLRHGLNGRLVFSALASDTAPGGPTIPLHGTQFVLEPGRYTITALLEGGISLQPPPTFTGGLGASFSLFATPLAIPEPQAWVLLALGMPLVAMAVRRARADQGAKGET